MNILETKIRRGSTFELSMLYASDKEAYREIEQVASVTPLRLTISSHGIPDGWPVSIECVKRPQEMNGEDMSATVIDGNTIEINGVQGSCWRAWDGSGVLRFPEPGDLAGLNARAMFRRNIRDEQPLITFHSSDPADGLILLNTEEHSITMRLPADFSQDLPLLSGVWDLEIFDSNGWVYPLVDVSPFTVTDEVTRD